MSTQNRPITAAILPVAGLGTRVLPATKAIPKELMPVVDKPVLQFVVEEALAAGIERIVLVTGRGKSAIEDHFDHMFELETALRSRGKDAALAAAADFVPEPGRIIYTRQQSPQGLGHAVWCARHAVGDGAVAVLLPDVIIKAQPGCLAQMIAVYDRLGGNVVALEEVPWEVTHRYGLVATGAVDGRTVEVTGMVEKPKPGEAPSNLSLVGRYILQPEVFAMLAEQGPGAGGEIQLTDAMAHLIGRQPFHGLIYAGRQFDCGDKTGYVEANAAYGLNHPEIGADVRARLLALLDGNDKD
ncbi:MAG: UTP--glucose-1-phosphate uridylyltransferase GalU [Alphaproteobacteria bacterium]